MLDFLPSKTSARKLRLFACGCCRSIWHLLGDRRSSDAIEKAEQFADGKATAGELEAAFFAAVDAADLEILEPTHFNARSAAMVAATPNPTPGDAGVVWLYAWRADPKRCVHGEQASLIRDVFGPLLFRPMTMNPSWLRPTVRQLAQSIYDEKAFERLPILGDALEDSGCDNQDILAHCRKPGEHVRGCWVVDLVLGKD
jgi:hypothetical protein